MNKNIRQQTMGAWKLLEVSIDQIENGRDQAERVLRTERVKIEILSVLASLIGQYEKLEETK